MTKSEWNGTSLPSKWHYVSVDRKNMVIAFLQGLGDSPKFWMDMSSADRRAVVLHLCAVGSVSYDRHERVRFYGYQAIFATRKAQISKMAHHRGQHEAIGEAFKGYDRPYHHPIEVARRQTEGYRASHPDIVQVWNSQAQRMLYPKPNGGQRILPSVYTKLTDRWLRGNGVYQRPEHMNQGHLRNTVALLNESHVNLVDRMCQLLGKMHAHLHNRPDLQRRLEDLHHELEDMNVDEFYPIVELIASHIELEQDDVEFDPRMIDNWNDADI